MGFSGGLMECGGLQRELGVDLGQGVPGDCPCVCVCRDIMIFTLLVWSISGS